MSARLNWLKEAREIKDGLGNYYMEGEVLNRQKELVCAIDKKTSVGMHYSCSSFQVKKIEGNETLTHAFRRFITGKLSFWKNL